MTVPVLSVRLFGEPLFLWQGKSLGHLQPKMQALLCYLAAEREGAHREALAELLWPPRRMQSVRQALHVLRSLPGSDQWLRVGDLVYVDADVDVRRFEAAVRLGQPEEALTHWATSTTFLHGVQAETPHFEDWLGAARLRLEDLRYAALRDLMAEAEGRGDLALAIKAARERVRLDPPDEEACRRLMRLERRVGNVEGALAAFEACRSALRRELGAEPGPDTLATLREVEAGTGGATRVAVLALAAHDLPGGPDVLFGREQDLREVLRVLSGPRRALLQGFGGSGKTALAGAVAAHWLEARRGAVLWLETGRDEPDAVMDALARPLGAQQQLARLPSAQRAGALRALLEERGVTLLVLDDVWNAYTLARVAEVLPAGAALLATARHRYPGLPRVRVGELPPSAARALLAHHAGRAPDAGEGAGDLCGLLQGHPFALRLAGITLRVTGQTPGELCARLAPHPHVLQPPPASSPDEGAADVEDLLRVSLQHLSDPAYEAFLGCGALFSPGATPQLLALVLRRDPRAAEDALQELTQHGLAERQAQPGKDLVVYRLHDLAYSYARAREAPRASAAAAAALSFLQEHKDDLEALDAEIANLLGAAEHAGQAGQFHAFVEFLLLLTVRGRYFTARGQSPRLRELLREAAQAAEQQQDWEAAHRLYGKLGDIHQIYLHSYREAGEHYGRARQAARLCQDVAREALYLNMLGIGLLHQGRSEAAAHLRDAVVLAQSCGHVLTWTSVLNDQACAHLLKREFVAAQALLRAALEVLPPAQPGQEADLEKQRFYLTLNLGETEFELGHHAAATRLKEEALELARAQDHILWIADALGDLAVMAQRLRNPSQAQALAGQALELYRQAGAEGAGQVIVDALREHGLTLGDRTAGRNGGEIEPRDA